MSAFIRLDALFTMVRPLTFINFQSCRNMTINEGLLTSVDNKLEKTCSNYIIEIKCNKSLESIIL